MVVTVVLPITVFEKLHVVTWLCVIVGRANEASGSVCAPAPTVGVGVTVEVPPSEYPGPLPLTRICDAVTLAEPVSANAFEEFELTKMPHVAVVTAAPWKEKPAPLSDRRVNTGAGRVGCHRRRGCRANRKRFRPAEWPKQRKGVTVTVAFTQYEGEFPEIPGGAVVFADILTDCVPWLTKPFAEAYMHPVS